MQSLAKPAHRAPVAARHLAAVRCSAQPLSRRESVVSLVAATTLLATPLAALAAEPVADPLAIPEPQAAITQKVRGCAAWLRCS
jgi:hypothetical protein